ncbi:MAG: glycosyltransferase [Rhodobacteraceae bacterium]|nr:glycosyltransferase [Paracoccaceae bacterium]
MSLLSVLIPAHDEARYIDACLAAVLASEELPTKTTCEVLVLANGCHDDTAARARQWQQTASERGWTLQVVEIQQGGKLNALNVGDGIAKGDLCAYLDADVVLNPEVLSATCTALATTSPRYAGGTPQVTPAQSAVTRAYARLWQQLPFVTATVPGFGFFAMNRAGRRRWQDWPDIISDDMFARLQFTPEERVKLPQTYSWPMVEGFRQLVRVRRRQNAGVTQIEERFPQLLANEDKPQLTFGKLARLALRDPVGFVVYSAVALAVKTPLYSDRDPWARGR